MIEKTAGSMREVPAWRQAAGDTAAALRDLSRAIASKDRAGVAGASDRIKTRYFDLLSAVAKARG
jgi:hypothetical protein